MFVSLDNACGQEARRPQRSNPIVEKARAVHLDCRERLCERARVWSLDAQEMPAVAMLNGRSRHQAYSTRDTIQRKCRN